MEYREAKFVIGFVLDGDPVPKARARFARKGPNVVTFTPAKTQQHENAIGYAAKIQMRGREPFTGPVELYCVFGVKIPSSWPKWKRREAEEGALRPTGRPDTDNYLKAVLDGLNGVIWKDDAQVVKITAKKEYALSGFTEIRVAECKSSTLAKGSTSAAP